MSITELFNIFRLKKHLNFSDDGKLKRRFVEVSAIYRGVICFVCLFVISIITFGGIYYTNYLNEQKDIEVICKAFEKSYYFEQNEKELIKLSKKTIEFKLKLLKYYISIKENIKFLESHVLHSIIGISKINYNKSKEYLIKLLQNTKDDYLKFYIVKVLGQLGDISTLQTLIEFYKKKQNTDIKYQYLISICKIKPDKQYIKLLITEALAHPIFGYDNKEEIIKTVGSFAGKDFNNDMWQMLDWWDKNK